MISISHWKKLSKSKPTEVWCLDSLGEHSMRFDRLSLCSQIKAIPIEDVVAMLTDIQLEIEETVKEEELIDKKWANGLHYSEKIIQQKIDALKVESEDKE